MSDGKPLITQEYINSFSFYILPKNSASPTLIIVNRAVEPPTVVKLWQVHPEEAKVKDVIKRQGKALKYEQRIYKDKIFAIKKEEEKAPLLHYIGDGCIRETDIIDYLKIGENEKAKIYLRLVLFRYTLDNESKAEYNKAETYDKIDNFIFTNFPEISQVSVLEFSCIILPYIECVTFSDVLRVETTDNVIRVFREIIKGIYLLYTNRVVHNDLHPGNIMIENDTGNVLIYDWDRAYSPDIGENPLLDSDVCNTRPLRCRESQCNLFQPAFQPPGYAIDFYKILFYICSRRKADIEYILTGIGLQNDLMDNGYYLYQLVRHALTNHKNKGFFMIDGENEDELCSWLQKPELDIAGLMLELANSLGDIDTILGKVILQEKEESGEAVGVSVGFALSGISGRLEEGTEIQPQISRQKALYFKNDFLTPKQTGSIDLIKKMKKTQTELEKPLSADAYNTPIGKAILYRARMRKQRLEHNKLPLPPVGKKQTVPTEELKPVSIAEILEMNEVRKYEQLQYV